MAKDPVTASSLPGEINAASRTLHTNLNRLITSRLPLCLPPHASSPQLFTTGLLHFAHVYLTFESLWHDLTLSTQQGTPSSPLLSFLLVDPWDADSDPENASPPSPRPSARMIAFLASLRPAGLARSSRVRKDLETLTGLSSTNLSVSLCQFPGAKVQEYCAHIRKVVAKKPHVLIAYAWCYYMAVFAGGRWIRGELRKGGDDFWQKGVVRGGDDEKREAVSLDDAGLSFFCFPGDLDGEDIKAEFKRRLSEGENIYTLQEREDIIHEAKEIFSYSAGLVEELDELLATNVEKVAAVEKAQQAREVAKSTDSKDIAGSGFLGSRAWTQRLDVPTIVLGISCVAWLAVYLYLGADRLP